MASAICLAAARGDLMIHRQDPVGLRTCDTRLQASLPPRSKRTQQGTSLAVLANLKPSGQTDIAHGLHQLAAMIRSKSLVLLFSDLLTDPQPVLQGLHHLRHRGNEIILFHILDEAEAHFPFDGVIEFEDTEDHSKLTIDARGMRGDYDLSRQPRHPVLGQHRDRRPLERIAGGAFDDEHVANELGMPLPLQAKRSNLGIEVQPALRRGFNTVTAAQVAHREPPSVALHRSVGFTPVGIYEKVGFKFGAWNDVAWFQRPLGAERPPGGEPIPIAHLAAPALRDAGVGSENQPSS